MKTQLPPLLEAFVTASNACDGTAFAACFAADAVVRDEGHEFQGAAAIRTWFDAVGEKYHAQMAVIESAEQAGETVLTARVSGHFDGSPITLRYRFTINARKIARLTIGL